MHIITTCRVQLSECFKSSKSSQLYYKDSYLRSAKKITLKCKVNSFKFLSELTDYSKFQKYEEWNNIKIGI